MLAELAMKVVFTEGVLNIVHGTHVYYFIIKLFFFTSVSDTFQRKGTQMFICHLIIL